MGNCIKKGEIRDIEIELSMMKTENQLQFERITGELQSMKQIMLPKDRRRSYNPYLQRNHDEFKYI